MKWNRWVTVLASAALSMVAIASAQAAEIKISSGGAFIDTIIKPYKDGFEKATGHKLIYTEKGFKYGVPALEKGEMDVIGGGFTMADFPKLLKKEAVEVKDQSAFQLVVVGEDKMVIAVNKTNPVQKLTKEQIKGIFTGKINNWKDVGGSDGEIIVVWTKFLQAPNETFIKQMLDGEPLLKDILEVNMIAEAKSNVINTPQAVMMYPSNRKDPNLKFPETPVISRPIIMMTKGAPSPAVKAWIEYVKAEYGKN